MAKREISSTLRNLKFMQRAAVREEITKKKLEEVEIKPDNGNFSSPAINRNCIVIMEGDPHPGAYLGRMSFQSFNPSVDKLNEEASKLHQYERSNECANTSSDHSGRKLFRGSELPPDGAECSKTGYAKSNGDLKRKQSEVVLELQHKDKSPKTEDGHQSSPNSNKGSFKQPKQDRLDWSVLRPKSQKKRG